MLDNVGYTHWNWNMLDTQQCTYLCTLRHSRIRGIVHVRGPTPIQTHGNQVAFAAALVLCTVQDLQYQRHLAGTVHWWKHNFGRGLDLHVTPLVLLKIGSRKMGPWSVRNQPFRHVFLGNNPVNLIWFNRGCCWEHGVSRCVI